MSIFLMEATSQAEWGPPLWKMLHWMAECSGRQRSKLLQDQELDSWKRLFTLLAVTLPCEQCKKHYSEYFARSIDLNMLSKLPPDINRREWIRRILYDLHERVNKGRGVKGISYDVLDKIYYELDFSAQRAKFYAQLDKGVRNNIVTRDNSVRLRNIIAALFGIYG